MEYCVGFMPVGLHYIKNRSKRADAIVQAATRKSG